LLTSLSFGQNEFETIYDDDVLVCLKPKRIWLSGITIFDPRKKLTCGFHIWIELVVLCGNDRRNLLELTNLRRTGRGWREREIEREDEMERRGG